MKLEYTDGCICTSLTVGCNSSKGELYIENILRDLNV